MNKLILSFALAGSAIAQSGQIQRWGATTGDVVVSAAYTATIQQPSSAAQQTVVDKVLVYCSVACSVGFYANGTAATSTAGTVTAILPTSLTAAAPFNFFTASNVGTGTQQGGTIHLPAGPPPAVFCFSRTCGEASDYVLSAAGTSNNFSVQIGSISGTVNITFLTHTLVAP